MLSPSLIQTPMRTRIILLTKRTRKDTSPKVSSAAQQQCLEEFSSFGSGRLWTSVIPENFDSGTLLVHITVC
jgi:hypothetical protein